MANYLQELVSILAQMESLLTALQENVFRVAKNCQVKHKHLQIIPQIHVFKNAQMSLITSLKM